MKTFLQLPKSVQIAFLACITVTIAAIAIAGVLLLRPRSGAAAPAIDAKQVVSDLNKVMLLDTNETPSVSAVADAAAVKSDPFFAHAETGDLVVVYPSSGRAILWRPSIKKIIEISIISVTPHE